MREGDLVYLGLDTGAELNLSAITEKYESKERAYPPYYYPHMMPDGLSQGTHRHVAGADRRRRPGHLQRRTHRRGPDRSRRLDQDREIERMDAPSRGKDRGPTA
ncbi:MAG: hypothetical protein V1790_15415 [Planctomycetota bacterium]